MGASRNLCHRGTRLTLRTGANDDNVLARQKLNIFLRNKIGQITQIAHLLCSRHGALDRATDNGNRPVICLCRLYDGLNTRDITGKTGDGHTPFCSGNSGLQTGFSLGFRFGAAFDHGIGRIAHHGKYAFITNLGQPCAVSIRAKSRCLVKFPIACMQHRAGRAANGKSHRIRDRMSKPDHLHRKTANVQNGARAHFDQRDVMLVAVLCQLAPQ